MPQYPRETNIAVKEGLDALVGDPQNLQIFAAPVATPEDLLQRGLTDETGRATNRGVLFTQLMAAGIFDERGALSPKGQAYAMPYEQVLAGGDETLGAYRVRMEDGIDKPPTTFSEQVDVVKDMVWDAGAGLGNRIKDEAQSVWNWGWNKENDKDLQARLDTSGAALVEGSIKATFDLAGMADVGMTHLAGIVENDQEHEMNVWRARQQRDKIFNDNQAAVLGETAEDFIGTAETVDRMAATKETLGKEQFDKLAKQGAALGEFTDATTLLPMGAAVKMGKLGVITRAGIKADKVLAKTAILDMRIAQATVEAAAGQRAANALISSAQAARKIETDLVAKFQATGAANLGEAAKRAGELAARHETTAAGLAGDLGKTQAQLAEMTALRTSLATRIPENIALATQRAMEAGKAAKALPVTAVAATAEKLGTGLIKLDEGLTSVSRAFGIGAAYDLLRSGVGQAGLYAAAATISPATAVIGVAGTVLRSGGTLQGLGKYGRVVGKELSKARGQVPFWQRVANHADVSPAHRAMSHRMDTATAGGAVSGAIRRTARGVVGAYPVDLLFEYLADDGAANGDTFKRAFAESLVIGGSTAALGGMFAGTKARHRELAIGDEANFRADLQDPIQRTLFNAIPNASRRAIATYAASNPQLNFRFTNQGSSSMSGNTATINVASQNPLKPLIGHEVMHNVVIRNQMEEGVIALMIGDEQAGGLLRSPDGTLDPNFEDFMSEYQNRMGAPVDLRTAALEYFVDSAAENFSNMAESGELGSIAGRTNARRAIGSLIDAVLPKIPLIRDLHFKMGGLMEQDGRMVMGSGLLADGIRELPQVRSMAKAMINASAGRSQGLFNPVGQGKGTDGGVMLPVQKGDKHLLDKMISIFETEEVDGKTVVKYDGNGDPIPLNPAKDMLRSRVGIAIGETLDKLKQQGKDFADGELRLQPDGTWEGNFLGEDVLREIEKLGILNREQMRILKNVNRAAGAGRGDRFIVINHPSTKKIGKKVRYATLAPTLRDVSPVSLMITKDGNLLVWLMSVTQLMNNIDTRAASKRGKNLYHGNKEAILNDVSAVMDMHRKNKRTDAYFDEKYGPIKAKEYKNFINTVFGLMSPSMADVNPLFDADRIGYKENVYKSYRIDRVSQATRMSGDTHIPMPLNYEAVKLNLMPNGVPTLDENGKPPSRQMPEPTTGRDPFYSQLERTIEAKIPSRATPDQIMATVKAAGVKAEEIKWSGIEQALQSLAVDGKVSKDAVLKYLADEGAVRFEEVTLGDTSPFDIRPEDDGQFGYYENGRAQFFGTLQEAQEYAENNADMSTEQGRPKFGQYTLPGGENYREVVLAMPVRGMKADDREARYNAMRESFADRNGGMTNESETAFDGWLDGKIDDSDLEEATGISPDDFEAEDDSQNRPQSEYTSSHFPDVPNYVAHMRTNERDGGLFIEELQSDRHQAGRKGGYKGDLSPLEEFRQRMTAKYGTAYGEKLSSDEQTEIDRLGTVSERGNPVYDAPFRTTWPLALFKRALRDAVAGGKTWIGWTVGATQGDRFDLSKSVSEVIYVPSESRLIAYDKSKNANEVMNQIVPPEKLADHIGKDAADKLLKTPLEEPYKGAGEQHTLAGDDLKIPATGMIGFYDNMLPKEIGKYVKQWGGKVEQSRITVPTDPKSKTSDRPYQSQPIWRIDITPEMRKGVKQGQPRFMPEPTDSSYIAAVEAAIAEAVTTARMELDALRKERNESQISFVQAETESGVVWDAEVSEDYFGNPPTIYENEGIYTIDESLTEYSTLEQAQDEVVRRVREELKDQGGTYGSDMDGKRITAAIFSAFPESPFITKPWEQTKWGSWYLEFRNEDGDKVKISVRDHGAVRADMGLPKRSFFVSKQWNPEEVGKALIDAGGYIQKNSPARAADAADMQSRETGSGSESRQSLGPNETDSGRVSSETFAMSTPGQPGIPRITSANPAALVFKEQDQERARIDAIKEAYGTDFDAIYWDEQPKPIVSISESGERIVQDGHHRVTAWKELGFPEVPIIEIGEKLWKRMEEDIGLQSAGMSVADFVDDPYTSGQSSFAGSKAKDIEEYLK